MQRGACAEHVDAALDRLRHDPASRPRLNPGRAMTLCWRPNRAISATSMMTAHCATAATAADVDRLAARGRLPTKAIRYRKVAKKIA